MRSKKTTKMTAVLLAVLTAFAMTVITACGTSDFVVTDSNEKSMMIQADRGDKGDFFMAGTLEVAEGEQVTVDANLEKGSVEIGLVNAGKNDDIDEVPDEDAKAQESAELTELDSYTFNVGPGNYLVKATIIEKATGAIMINVQQE